MRLRVFPLVVLLLGGCQQVPLPTLTPYKMDIQQGNVVTQEMMAKLKPGMTPSQVRFILGTPLVVDAFHKDRWDYVYRFAKRGTVQESRRIVIVFKDDKLERIEGDVVPAQAGSVTEGGVAIDKPAPAPAKPAAPKPAAAAPPPATTAAQPQASGGGTGSDPAASAPAGDGASGDAAKARDDKAKEEKPKEERGFFGRMLDQLGF